MKFRTEINITKTDIILNPAKPVVLIGSCFTENIAVKMRECLWNAINVTGTLFNPVSISRALKLLLLNENCESEFLDSLFTTENVWRSWLFDSGLMADNAEECIYDFLRRKRDLDDALKHGNVIIVTFGTSVCYCLKKDSTIVGNCHKQSSSLFFEHRLKINEIADAWNSLLRQLKDKFPHLQVIFTLSPVRHLKNGFEGNNRSKAILSLAIEEIINSNPWCDYFPAYEIMNDDLRDYRFYAKDLVHPSEEAVNYIWTKFQDTYIDKKGLEILKEGERINRGLLHKVNAGINGKIPESILKKERSRLLSLKEDFLKFKEKFPFTRNPGFQV